MNLNKIIFFDNLQKNQNQVSYKLAIIEQYCERPESFKCYNMLVFLIIHFGNKKYYEILQMSLEKETNRKRYYIR